ncbi:hypothetical protein QC820_16605, partial [Halomonas mongoliensis]
AEGRELTDEEREQVKRIMNLTAKASFPEDLAGSLTVLVNYHSEQGNEQNLGGARYAAGNIVPVDRYGQEFRGDDPLSSPSGIGVFGLEQEGERKTMLFDSDLEAAVGRLEAIVLYFPEAGLAQEARYIMELSR